MFFSDLASNVIFATCDFDASTDESAQFQFTLPSWFDATGSVDVDVYWYAAATTGETCWCVNTASVAVGESMDPAFNDPFCANGTAQGTTNRLNKTTLTGIDKDDWAAGEMAFVRLKRNADASDEGQTAFAEDDDMTGDAKLVRVTFTVRVSK